MYKEEYDRGSSGMWRKKWNEKLVKEAETGLDRNDWWLKSPHAKHVEQGTVPMSLTVEMSALAPT